MGKYIIYQGYNEQFRWREVDAEGATVLDEDGLAHQSDLLPSREDAIAAVTAFDPLAEFDIKPTIQEVAEGDNE